SAGDLDQVGVAHPGLSSVRERLCRLLKSSPSLDLRHRALAIHCRIEPTDPGRVRAAAEIDRLRHGSEIRERASEDIRYRDEIVEPNRLLARLDLPDGDVRPALAYALTHSISELLDAEAPDLADLADAPTERLIRRHYVF